MSFEVINFGLATVALFAVGLVRHSLRVYVQERAKNLATRRDVEDMTRKVEQVRAQFTADHEQLKHILTSENERLKAELQRSQRVLQALFDFELDSYKEIYAAVVDVREATVALRPNNRPGARG